MSMHQHSSSWFFVVLGGLAIGALITPIWYNTSIQLTREPILAAQERWRAYGLADYDLVYQEKQTDRDYATESSYRVVVRRGKTAAIWRDDRLIHLNTASQLALGGRTLVVDPQQSGKNVEKLLSAMLAWFDQDARLEERVYAMAVFDRRDGHPTRYVRRNRKQGTRIEWTIKLIQEAN